MENQTQPTRRSLTATGSTVKPINHDELRAKLRGVKLPSSDVEKEIQMIDTPTVETPKVSPAAVPTTAPSPTTQNNDLIARLLAAPQRIADAQRDLDSYQRQWERRKVQLTIEAYNKPLFPGKKEGEAMRVASNDSERDAAIASVLTTDDTFAELSSTRDLLLRALNQEKNQFDALKIALQYLTATK